MAVLPSRHGMAVNNNAELVSVRAAGTAEHTKYMQICHERCYPQQGLLNGHRALIGAFGIPRIAAAGDLSRPSASRVSR